MNQFEYSYCFLRYRRDPEAGEFANIGVALWSPQARFLAFKGCDRYSRLTHFFGDLDRDGYHRLVTHVERRFDILAERMANELQIDKSPANIREIAREVVPEDDGSLIWSPIRGGFTDDPASEVPRIFERFIGCHYKKEGKPRRDEDQVFREVYRKAFTSEAIAPLLHAHEIIAPLASHNFKYAWKNGVWNVYETISFDLVEAESIERKAHTWYGRSMHLAASPDHPKIHFLLGKPAADEHLQLYGQAKEILLSAQNVRLIEEQEADAFALRLASEVAKAA
ncbi:MAG: hypothetical protein JWR26_3376 [Pedosphaera sp.]|nr:hypothetical protein [Pedosphaera sp.]